jgi:hypothetical protein
MLPGQVEVGLDTIPGQTRHSYFSSFTHEFVPFPSFSVGLMF